MIHPGHHIAFAHRLRGVAALFGLLLHHYLSFLDAPPQGVMSAINMPAVESKGYVDLILLLSGRLHFNLLRSILQLGRVRCWPVFPGQWLCHTGSIAARSGAGLSRRPFFPLWPTYAVSLVLIIAMLAFASYVAGNPLPFRLDRLGANLLLVEDLIFGSTTDLVSWTS